MSTDLAPPMLAAPPAIAADRPERPRVSIIISNYNYERYVGAAIESALGQTAVDCEVVVVDDGSTDNSRQVIDAYRDDPRLRVILQQNAGQAAAMNSGFAASTGDIVIFLDADDQLRPEAAARVAENWQPGLSRCQYALEIVDTNNRVIGLHPFCQRMEAGDMQWKLIVGGYFWFVPTSGNAFSRSALLKTMPIPAQDWRVCADAYLISISGAHGLVKNLSEPLGLYRVHGSNNWYREIHDREHIRDIWRHRLRIWRAAIESIQPWATSAAANTTRDYSALHTYRRIVAAQGTESGPVDARWMRSALWSACWRILVAKIPVRHKVLYSALFTMASTRGWRFPAVAKWNAHHSYRPPVVRRIVDRLKGSDFYLWMAPTRAPEGRAAITFDTPLEFGRGRSAAKYLGYGWDESEAWISWTVGHTAAIIGALPPEYHDVQVSIQAFPYLGGFLKSQRLVVAANGLTVCEKELTGEGNVEFAIPRALAARLPQLVLTFTMPDAVMPRLLPGGPGDYRPLGVAFRSIRFSNIAIGGGKLNGPYVPVNQRLELNDASLVESLGAGWHSPVGGVVRMARREAFLQMSLLDGAAFDHIVTLEFDQEDSRMLQRSLVRLRFNAKAQHVFDLVLGGTTRALIPKGTISETGELSIRVVARNLLPASNYGFGDEIGAVGPGLRAITLERLSLPAHMPVYSLGHVLEFRAEGSARPFMSYGWRASDSRGALTSDVSAAVVGMCLWRDRELFLTAVVYPAVDRPPFVGQTVRIVCNELLLAEYVVTERCEVTAILPPGFVGDDLTLRIDFRVSTIASPSDVGAGDDHRPLGIGVEALRLD